MVRPSYVLGGRAMECVHDEQMLDQVPPSRRASDTGAPHLIDKFLENAHRGRSNSHLG